MTPRKALKLTFAREALWRTVRLAVLIGTALNAINQGPEMLAGQAPVIWKLALTYFMPFAVASYGRYSALRES